jgi:hypothetical protein
VVCATLTPPKVIIRPGAVSELIQIKRDLDRFHPQAGNDRLRSTMLTRFGSMP